MRHVVKVCRFGIPFFPLDKTRVIHPFVEDDELNDTELELKEQYKADGKKIRKYLDENVTTLQSLTTNFDEFLAEINMNLDDYLKAIQTSISSSKESVEEGSPTKTILRNLTSKFYNVNEVSVQEAAYNLLQLRMVETSLKTIYVSTGPETFRSRILKPKIELAKLHPESSDICQRLD
ncbi:hypothetical protein INT47_009205 [Mucor saturninus]|uniref:Uncharacterized protein n=1 Tax=Mucor saturninus TaxID=64648 RepID=A0A8H7V7Z7_9FUNG|nr:hypothetical protein INT47_009205 [Mucor saturninus]